MVLPMGVDNVSRPPPLFFCSLCGGGFWDLVNGINIHCEGGLHVFKGIILCGAPLFEKTIHGHAI